MQGNPFKLFGKVVLSATGLLELWHGHFCRRKISILMYHAVVKSLPPISDACFLDHQTFRSQVAYLKKHFSVLPLSRVVEGLKNGANNKPIAILTFDDGFQNNFDVAFPILCEYAMPATIFLTTGLIDSTDTTWSCRLNHALSCTTKKSLEWGETSLDLSNLGQKTRAYTTLQRLLKQLPGPSLNSALLEICKKLEIDLTQCIETGSPFQMLRSDSIKTMLGSGLIELGAHTETHAILSLLAPEQQRREIMASLKKIQQLTGRPCTLFAYPNGCLQDYDQVCIKLLKEAGVLVAVSSILGPNDASTPLMELRRYHIGPNIDLATFRLMVLHVLYYYRIIKTLPHVVWPFGVETR